MAPPDLAAAMRGVRAVVTEVAPIGRPVHIELGHAVSCARLARDQAADDQERLDRIPGLRFARPTGQVEVRLAIRSPWPHIAGSWRTVRRYEELIRASWLV